MRGNDISNESPTRWMVTLDALLEPGQAIPKKNFRRSWEYVARNTRFETLNLGRIWRAADHHGLRFEMAVFEQPFEYCEALESNLDRLGVHPIFAVMGYRNRATLQSALAFRPDVRGVVDSRGLAMMWGHRGMAVEDL